jgi:hypothetical protein
MRNRPSTQNLRGTVDGIAVAVTGNLGPLEALVDRRLPYPLELSGEVNGRKSAMRAKITRADAGVGVQDIDVTSGSSTFKGAIEVRNGGSKPMYNINIASAVLSLDELAMHVANAGKSTVKGVGGNRLVFSDSSLGPESLLSKDADGNVAIDKLVLRGGRQIETCARNSRCATEARRTMVQASAFGSTVSASLTVDAAGGRAIQGSEAPMPAVIACRQPESDLGLCSPHRVWP